MRAKRKQPAQPARRERAASFPHPEDSARWEARTERELRDKDRLDPDSPLGHLRHISALPPVEIPEGVTVGQFLEIVETQPEP